MTLFACKCLNVVIKSECEMNLIEKPKLETSPAEQRDLFFHENTLSGNTDNIKVQSTHLCLLTSKNVGKWLIHICLTCGVSTHATQPGTKNVLINQTIKTNQDTINSLKQAKNYSPVFNILVPEKLDETVPVTDKGDQFGSAQNAILSSLSCKLKSTLKEQLERIEESVRLYRDMKYAEYEAFKERMEREHKIVSSLVNQNKSKLSDNKENFTQSPQLPLQRRRLSSIKDAKKLKQYIIKNSRKSNPEDDMSDLDDVFDMDGGYVHTHNSDADDSDSEANMTADERYAMARSEGKWDSIARSLPMDMPKIPDNLGGHFIGTDENEIDPQNIAASIKALARSVHGDVFGELPRPRLSTQI